MPATHAHTEPDIVHRLARGYGVLILAILGLSPIFAILYLHAFQDPTLRFEHHLLHELAIAVSVAQSGFITYVAWRCYRYSGEPLLRWLMLGFFGFTLIYALHGAFTRQFDHNTAIFVLYGPVARLVMAICFLVGLLQYLYHTNEKETQPRRDNWPLWITAFLLINLLVFLLGNSPWSSAARGMIETLALCLALVSFLIMVAQRVHTPLMTLLALSLVCFALASLSFLLSEAWNHQWWLAHGIFAAGFMVLSYGVIQAFLTTGSFATVYSHTELMEQIQSEKTRAERALRDLQRAHSDLENLAAKDPLTGAANRREFLSRAEAEISRALRNGMPLGLIMLDIDHFKALNDQYGHQAGDKVLQEFVSLLSKPLRQSDLIGRLGGEEFAILLPEATLEMATEVAERLRRLVAGRTLEFEDKVLRVTASFGVAELGPDATRYDPLLAIADQRLYEAKRLGRNRVVAQ